jgi:hypothetical protein
MIGGHMKIFSIAAVLTGIVLVSMTVKRRKNPSGRPLSGESESDRRYAIDELLYGLE